MQLIVNNLDPHLRPHSYDNFATWVPRLWRRDFPTVTGAASGFGHETALAFARGGAEVLIGDVDIAGLQETERLVTAASAAVHSYVLDVFGLPTCKLDSAGIGLTAVCPGVIGTNIVEATRISLPEARSQDGEKIHRRVRTVFGLRHYGTREGREGDRCRGAVEQARSSGHARGIFMFCAAHAAPQAMRSAVRGGKLM